MFTAYAATKGGKITLCAMPSRRREVEKAAADMSKGPDVERVSVAAYGRISRFAIRVLFRPSGECFTVSR